MTDTTTTGDRRIDIDRPDSFESSIRLVIDDVPEDATPHIDYFYGRPAMYFYHTHSEECQMILILPTDDSPALEVLMNGEYYNDELAERLRKASAFDEARSE